MSPSVHSYSLGSAQAVPECVATRAQGRAEEAAQTRLDLRDRSMRAEGAGRVGREGKSGAMTRTGISANGIITERSI